MSDDSTTTPETPEAVAWETGGVLPELAVTPDKYLTVRYAGASGDFNPIHVDEEFAQQVGLPGRILHGLWTMAQVARAATEAVGGDEAPGSLRRLEVAFRGMAVPEEPVVVTGEIKAVEEGLATISLTARQGKARVVRGGRAVVRVPDRG
ncbi:MaoC/PaaZ C-terminal domain-containing protein [Patulibacter sp.]|uniref:MaoC family dehydratase n=1 Tax=Patulibacter sp. TaxID=1912859 RepID=UPI0027193463|nr:MaoC/PaaZ C-terminal domain-containing protein [Patulibacter sp.]MDO9408752.1 MaoC/PaaZ C-terminal domain-containing protein [Patulibacter sp.]